MRDLNTFINHLGKHKVEFGDFILFQEYSKNSSTGLIEVSRPKFVVFLGWFPADQTVGFNYAEWVNPMRTEISERGYKVTKQVGDVKCHIEWDEYIDIIGFWKKKPNWKKLLAAYRKQNKEYFVEDFNVSY